MRRVLITDDQRQEAHKMRLAGKPWQAVEIALGVNYNSLRKSMRIKGLEMQGNLGKRPAGKLLSAPAHEIRFHVMRLGNRKNVASLYGVGYGSVYQALPVSDIDHYQQGQMVSIGGIMIKKCFKCGVARELESFWACNSKSGCRESCEQCRLKAKVERYNIH